MNIDTLVESFYTNKDETESLINEVMDLMTSAGITEGSDLLTEVKGFSAARFFDSIFTPNITEQIGVEDNNETRATFIKSMKGIRGNTLREKINGVKQFMQGADAEAEGADTVLSYLTFLKCFSEVFEQYSPSGSGFLLEAFLAGLLKGRQLVEKTDETGGTLPIVDYETGSGDPVSLKRLTGGTGKTPIKGSIQNLAYHIAQNPDRGIDYVIAAIYGEEQEIAFFEFNIDADNFIFWVGQYIKVPPSGFGAGTALQEACAEYFAILNEQEEKGQFTPGPKEREDLLKTAQNFSKRVNAIQMALGVPPGAVDKDERKLYGDITMPLIKTSKSGLEQVYFGRPLKASEKTKIKSGKMEIPPLANAEGIKKAAKTLAKQNKFVEDMKKTKEVGGQVGEALQTLTTISDATTYSEFAQAATVLSKAFRAAESQLAPTGRHFSKVLSMYKKLGDTTKAGTLSDLPEPAKAAFPNWLRDPKNREAFMSMIKESTKKEGAKSQFSIAQERVRQNEYYIDTIQVNRKNLLRVTNKYNVVVKERLQPIFLSVDRLMDRLQSFYVNNRVAAGEKASEECAVLKTNVDEEIKFRKK